MPVESQRTESSSSRSTIPSPTTPTHLVPPIFRFLIEASRIYLHRSNKYSNLCFERSRRRLRFLFRKTVTRSASWVLGASRIVRTPQFLPSFSDPTSLPSGPLPT